MRRPIIPRPLLIALLGGALLGGAGATPAHAADTPMARFLVSYEGERTVGWDEPRWSPRYDCQHIYWTQSTGSERWQVKSKPQKALLWQTSYGDVNLHIGTWDPRDISDEFSFQGNGFVERRRFDSSGFDANDRCGPATSQVDPPRPDDCGNRLPREHVVVNIRKGVVDVDVYDVRDRNSPPGYRSCSLIFPPGAPSDWPDEVTGKLNVKDLFNPARARVTVAARRSWSNVSELMGGKGTRSERAAVRWTLTFERVLDKQPPAKRRPARRRGGRGRR